MTQSGGSPGNPWPALSLAGWLDTYATLHLWTQLVGKTRLAFSPPENHGWHLALYVSTRGLRTSPVPDGQRAFEVEFDFLDHQLVARRNDGEVRKLKLEPRPTADFYREYLALLGSLDIHPHIWPVPSEIPGAARFTEDRVHAAYDPDAARRCWQVMVQVDRVFKKFRGRFLGKCSPVHFWWGAFDLACTRFSGRRAPVHPGGVPGLPDRVTREAYSHECISVGWWPGIPGGPVAEPAFYAYAYPEPDGCAEAPLRPGAAAYHPALKEWILPYEAVRQSADPDADLLAFLESTYEAAAIRGGWDRGALEVGGNP